MVNNTFITVPQDVSDPIALYRFLSQLVEKLDVAFGARADNPFVTKADFTNTNKEVTSILGTLAEQLSDTNASTLQDRIRQLELNLNQPGINDSSLSPITFSATYTQAELDALEQQVLDLQDTVNGILNSLRLSKILQS